MKIELWQKLNHKGTKIAVKRGIQNILNNRDTWRIPVREELSVKSSVDVFTTPDSPLSKEVVYKRIKNTPMFESENETDLLIGY